MSAKGTSGQNTRTPRQTVPPSPAILFARLWDTASGRMTSELARHILTIGFPEADQARMHALAVKNQERQLSSAEREELDNYVTVADLLSLLKSKARQCLKKPS